MKLYSDFWKKFILLCCLICMQVALLYFYFIHEDFIKNFKSEYITEIYFPLLEYELSALKDDIAQAHSSNDTTSSGQFAEAVPVLLYHSIVDEPDGSNVTIPNFFDQMMLLKKRGYTTISIGEFYEFMQGKRKLPERSILITFDDGSKTTYYPVDPILRVLGYHATTFLITRYSIGEGTRYYLSSKEVKSMIQSGHWEPQVHSKYGHNFFPIDKNGALGRFYPNKFWLREEKRFETDDEYTARVIKDFTEAKKEFEKEYQIASPAFAFPFGDYGQNKTNFPNAENILLRELPKVYAMLFYQVYAGSGYMLNYPDRDTYMMGRIIVDPQWSAAKLLDVLDASWPKKLPYQDRFGYNNGWIRTWGKQSVSNNSLLLTTQDSNGGSVFLDGSFLWKDYQYDVDIGWKSGDSLTLLSRYANNDNYVSCNITEDYVAIQQVRLGIQVDLAIQDYKFSLRDGDSFHAGMKVSGDSVSCFLNGHEIIIGTITNEYLQNGGIGFKNWGIEKNQSKLFISNLLVVSTK